MQIDSPAVTTETHRFSFTGNGSEYFKIWIVNLVLSVLTLGIYSAWAKVRNKQYFYGNTRFADASFQYTANPVQILKGRVIAVIFLVVLNILSTVAPIYSLYLTLLIIPLFPWIVCKSLAFNHHYSRYRGISFGFDGKYWEAFKVTLLWYVPVILTMGVLYPFVAHRFQRFKSERSRFGQTHFEFNGDVGYFFLVYIVAYVGTSAVLVLIGILVTAVFYGLGINLEGLFDFFNTLDTGENSALQLSKEEAPQILVGILMVLVYIGFISLGIIAAMAIRVAIANHCWSRMKLGGLRFSLQMSIVKFIWISVSNLILIILTFGIFIPWAKVRIARYWVDNMSVMHEQDLDNFIASEKDSISSTGSELGDVMDFDIGL